MKTIRVKNIWLNDSDAMEVLREEGDTTDWECSKCGKEFTVSFSTKLGSALQNSTKYKYTSWHRRKYV